MSAPPKNPEMTSAHSSSKFSSQSSAPPLTAAQTPSTTFTAELAAQPSTSAGNPSNTVDNLILTPTSGAALPYGKTYTIQWHGTTEAGISVYYRTLPSTSLSLIPDCQNMLNYPGSVNACPWLVTPSPLPEDTHSGFQIVLVWNSTAAGRQVSPEFGVAGGPSSPSSATTSSTTSSSTPTSPPPITPHSKSSSLALGLSLGLGLPLLLLMLLAACIIRRRSRRNLIAPVSNLPKSDGTSRLQRAMRDPANKGTDAATLLANYRNAEHFGFVPTKVKP